MKAIFINRNFLLIMSGKLISLMGNSIFDIAVIWYVLSKYGKTGASMLGWIMAMAILPMVIFGSLAGSIIDRYNKKFIMIISDFISGIVVFLIVFLMNRGILNSIEILLVTGILSITSSTVRITVNSIIPEIFKEKELYDANAANQFVERGTSLLGYAIGGGLVALIGVNHAFLLNGISFIICALFEMFIVLPVILKDKFSNEKKSLINDFKEVAEFLKENRSILRITLIFTSVNFLWDPIFNIATPYVMKNTFNITSTKFGLLQAALPMGFCLGALYFSKNKTFLKNKFVLFNSIIGANSMFFLFSLPIILSGYFSKNNFVIYYFIFTLLVLGVFSAAINISASVAIQTMVSENIRGKFMGLSSSLSAGLTPLGGVILGALVGRINCIIIYAFSIAAVYLIIVLIPKRSYSFENRSIGVEEMSV